MKLIIDKDHKNSKGKHWQDGDCVKTYVNIQYFHGNPKSHCETKPPDENTIEFDEPWIEYDYKKDFKTPVYTQEEQEIYEWFCCGYLSYYEKITRNDVIDYGIHFVWGPEKVSIYLYPSPIRVKSSIKPAIVTGIDPQPPPVAPPPPQAK